MSFWESELGKITGKAEDAFAKSFTQIPDGTMALARIDKFINDEFNGNKFLKIEWILTDGDFRGAKVEQKLKVWGTLGEKDPEKTRYRALNMLKLIYQLYNTSPKHSNPPTDQDLAVFVGKSAGIKIRETEPNDQGRQYNWVSEIHDAKGFKSETGIKIEVMHKREDLSSAFDRNPRGSNTQISDLGMIDDVPF